ncbi:hypothetical protein [Kallotenue papyrolyticum]|uniref:hypothetical protein n=1 Tax=Kallotenue papyrolyticum TaxID=1325125 RepID=UPI0004929C3B|nr:hypothetical protein [Kallotenue papyrolyticum]
MRWTGLQQATRLIIAIVLLALALPVGTLATPREAEFYARGVAAGLACALVSDVAVDLAEAVRWRYRRWRYRKQHPH